MGKSFSVELQKLGAIYDWARATPIDAHDLQFKALIKGSLGYFAPSIRWMFLLALALREKWLNL